MDTPLAELRSAVDTVQRIVRQAQPANVSGDTAMSMVDLFGELERAAASGIALYSPIVMRNGSYAKAGHASAPDWLGAVSGSSAGVAKGRLAAAERAAANPALTEALHGGDLSAPQLKLMSETVAVAPDAVETLLDLAGNGASHQELNDTASRAKAAARNLESERARRERVHQGRHFRWRQCPEGGIRGEFFCDEIVWAQVQPQLEAEAKERWKAAGKGEPLEAHRLDAFISIMGGSDGGGRGGGDDNGGARPHTLVIVDAEALRRGTTQGDELCEIEGIGPVSVDAVVELVGEGGMQLLVKDGVDIRTVTSTRRDLPQRVEAALTVRDRTCVVQGCGKRHGLEADHCWVDYGDDGPTCLDNLARLCPEHHDLKTFGGFRLEGGPGKWKWIAPAHPKSAQYIARARQLAAAKAKAKRNNPRLT
jgi:hypothetical protein